MEMQKSYLNRNLAVFSLLFAHAFLCEKRRPITAIATELFTSFWCFVDFIHSKPIELYIVPCRYHHFLTVSLTRNQYKFHWRSTHSSNWNVYGERAAMAHITFFDYLLSFLLFFSIVVVFECLRILRALVHRRPNSISDIISLGRRQLVRIGRMSSTTTILFVSRRLCAWCRCRYLYISLSSRFVFHAARFPLKTRFVFFFCLFRSSVYYDCECRKMPVSFSSFTSLFRRVLDKSERAK